MDRQRNALLIFPLFHWAIGAYKTASTLERLNFDVKRTTMGSFNGNKEVIQLIDKFFIKATSLICATKSSRYQTPSDLAPQFDEEWLLSETDEDLEHPDVIQEWSLFDGEKDLPPLVIETYLDLRRVDPSQWVTLKDDEGNLWNVCKGAKKSEIMLERWLIELDRTSASFKSHKPTLDETTNFVQQLILLFRYLYTLIQLLPASDLHASLRKVADVQGVSSPIEISTRILDGSKPILSKGRIGLSKPIISTYSNVVNESNVPSHLEQRKITPVWTKFGLLRISVSYRHDCRFEVHDPEEETPGNQYISETTARRLSANRSPSLSPQARGSSISSMENPSQRKPVAISRQFQVFKVGSVGSVPTSQSQMMIRNPSSSSSAVANLQAQRSNYSPVPSNPTMHGQDTHNEGTSVGSASKYSSSFGRIRRHSSTKYSEHGERPARSNKQQEDQSDALLDFVKLIDQKPELKLNKNRSVAMDISNSLMKFQNLKPTNDFISENLSLSTSMDPSHASQRRRSSSHSPVPSFSPAINYPSIPSRFSQTSLNENPMESRLSSHEVSREPHEIRRPSMSSPHGSSVSSQRHSTLGREVSSYAQSLREDSHVPHDIYEDDDDDDLLMHQAAPGDSRLKNNRHARSLENMSSSVTRNRLPIPQPSLHSQPITTAVPAFAKMHRPGRNESGQHENERKKSVSDGNADREDDEDEDLLFFMSDMSLSKM